MSIELQNETTPLTDELLVLFGGGPRGGSLGPSTIRTREYVSRIAFSRSEGDSFSLPYASLRFIHFDGRILTLIFNECVLKLHGRKLMGLYDALGSHGLSSVKTIDPDRCLVDEDVAVVTRIEFRPRKRKDENSELPGFEAE